MNFQFCFTLDTEPDNLWCNPSVLTFEHTKRLPKFHERMCQAGARPVYLTTSEMAESREASQVLRWCMEQGNCEIGAHFHTWTREWPFFVPELRNPYTPAMAHQLGQDVEEAMLAYTCRHLYNSFGVWPSSYRGGRWSLSADSARSLRNCGIVVDSTVTPGISWKDPSHPLVDGPDYTRASRHPSTVAEVFGRTGGENDPIEVPVGSAWFPQWLGSTNTFVKRQFSRAGVRTPLRLGHRWLRPTCMSVEDMTAVMESLKAAEVPVWVFMIHSSEISPCKPLPTEADVALFVDRCEQAIRAAVELGATAATLTEASRALLPVNVEGRRRWAIENAA